jgi:hypothetical protein
MMAGDGGDARGFSQMRTTTNLNQNYMKNHLVAAPPQKGHRSCSGERVLRRRTPANYGNSPTINPRMQERYPKMRNLTRIARMCSARAMVAGIECTIKNSNEVL